MDEEPDERCENLESCTRPHDWRTGKHVPSGPTREMISVKCQNGDHEGCRKDYEEKPGPHLGCSCQCKHLNEQQKAEKTYPDHHPETALANWRAGREVWDTNGDLW